MTFPIATDVSNFFSGICDLQSMEKTSLEVFKHDFLCGEMFLEYSEDEVLRIENGVVQSPNLSFKKGFGLRSFNEDNIRYSCSSHLNSTSVKKASEVVKFFENKNTIHYADDFKVEQKNKNHLYDTARFINEEVSLENKIAFLKKVDSYARSKYLNITQVIVVLASSWKIIEIIKDSGEKHFDIRPLVKLTVSIIVSKDRVMESGMYSGGGRYGYNYILNDSTYKYFVDEAVRQAAVKMEAINAPVGEMPVVLGNGWTGILLHEAIGHGLEGDAIRKKTSVFHNLYGEMIAAPNITVVDDGTIEKARGSINIDDEGYSTKNNVLIENGKLVGFMYDRMNAKLMNAAPTGNGRRESYRNIPIPRMTNTFMIAGNVFQEEMIRSIKNGIFAKSFSDGQVDVTSGKFVFSASEAYLIENGKITAPVKGAMLIGDGPSILKKISMVGNDFSLDPGVGTCGKDGQWVPVGVGQPSVLIDSITVGGSNL